MDSEPGHWVIRRIAATIFVSFSFSNIFEKVEPQILWENIKFWKFLIFFENSLKSLNLALVNSEDKSLEFLASANYEAQMLVEVQGESATSKEYLLIFNKVAVYVDELGNS